MIRARAVNAPCRRGQGAELYLREWPGLVGERFGTLLHGAADGAVPVGIRRDRDGAVVLCPPDDTARPRPTLLYICIYI